MFYAIDSADAVSQLLQQLQNHYDVIISTGGVSVGDYDFIRPISAAVGFEHIFWKVKQKPGKPLLFGRHQRADNTCCYLLGLPGNPAAVYVGLHIYATTLLACLQGKAQYPAYFSAVLAEGMKTDTRARFLRMQGVFEQGVLTVRTLPKQQSHMLSNLMQANCLIMIPHDVLPQAGDIVQGIFIE
jgi:molybdopterin molybdotransferase